MSQRLIQDQVKLPLSVAFGVVLQGIRIRFGRSLVTISGVVLGIAFLMSILTSQLVKQGVSAETELRAELSRMTSFLAAEVGAVKDRQLGIVETGQLDAREQRLLRQLASDGAQLGALAPGNNAAILLGPGPFPTDGLPPVVCYTRQGAMPATPAARRVVSLDRELKPDELARLATLARETRARTIWIIVISLLVTVIGISNAMLMSVTERFREIGTMKCLGALSAFIREIFFIESSLVGLVGSLVGSVAGALVAVVIYSATYGVASTLGALTYGTLAGYLALSVVAGVVLSVVAAIYPASFASKMVPAHALRSNV